MKSSITKVFLILGVLLITNSVMGQKNLKENKISIIPAPVSVIEGEGSYKFFSTPSVLVLMSGKSTQREEKEHNSVKSDKLDAILKSDIDNSLNFLKEYVYKFYSLDCNVTYSKVRNRSLKDNIILSISPQEVRNAVGKEIEGSYTLNVSAAGVEITGYDARGLFYGVQSLLQLLPTQKEVSPLEVPNVRITDYPRFPYRGMHFDVVRHIFPVDYIKKYIDYLALHKMSYFHMHLTDDQGWRMESLKYPQLNTIGSWRDGTIIGIFPGTGVDSTRYGGFYTVAELKEIVKYAADRYITIIPEIDVPGHSMAIIAAFPQFSTTPHIPKKPAITWGIYNRQNNVLAPSEELFVFLSDVFNEMMDIFPSEYIHIGADEVAKRWWNNSESTKEFMMSHNLKDGNELQRYFVERLAKIMEARGRKIVGWDEMVDDGLVENSVVMSWRDEKGALKAARQGHLAIMTPKLHSYFNIAQKPNEDSLCHNQWVVTTEDVYGFEPISDSLSNEEAARILGGQGCMWTEYFPNTSRVEYGIFPRLSALSEVYWSPKNLKNWPDFLKRLQVQYLRYNLWGANSFKELYEEKEEK